jgi:hypothetical protein
VGPPGRPRRTSGRLLEQANTTQQADPGRAEHHTPRDRGHGTAFIVCDACVQSGFRIGVDGSAEAVIRP